MQSKLLCRLAMVAGLAFAAVETRGQCGDPDPSNVILNDADIWHITGGDLLTVLANPFPDNSQVGNFIAVRNIIDQPINYFRIISNQHFAQNNTSVFTVAEDLESSGGRDWWLYFELSKFDIVGSIECEDCEFDDDCDDGDECTTDECDPDEEYCVYTPIDCDDDNACTTDYCDDGECMSDVISCDDGNACTIDACDIVTGCESEPIDCDDGDACTADSCSGGVCSSDPICGADDGCCDASCDPGSDPDCFVCGERRDRCSSNSDCCSNKCRRGRCR